ncbi:hypothetical protein ART_3518 [Arthrobacter sp. PAMC 25486]|nr:hypothetical protein ART_3518 [Arthrobacter sp. PAMC 25486]
MGDAYLEAAPAVEHHAGYDYIEDWFFLGFGCVDRVEFEVFLFHGFTAVYVVAAKFHYPERGIGGVEEFGNALN